MKFTKKTAKKLTSKKSPNGGRGENTRRMILDAATKVFAMHPYNAASIRTIAAQGKFYHGLIRYHFPNKAIIFETVIEEACQNIRRANRANFEWLSEISTRSPEEVFSFFLDRFIEFSQNQPEVFRIIILNNAHDDLVSLPGYRHLEDLVINAQKDFVKKFQRLMPIDLARRFLNSLIILLLHYLASSNFWAETLGMDPKSDEYRQWVKETILFVFLPAIKEMMPSD